MQFKVPQFLDIEDKLFGPFTFSEFVYLAGGAGVCFVIYKAWGVLLGAIPIIIVAGFSAALVFYKPNGKPLVDMIESGFKYYFQDKLYIWKRSIVKKAKKEESKDTASAEIKTGVVSPHVSRLGGEKLRDLAWSLDILDIKKGDTGN